MKRTLLLFAVVGFASASAMAQGPPLADNPCVAALHNSQVTTFANESFGIDTAARGGGSGGIASIPGPAGLGSDAPRNERMLN